MTTKIDRPYELTVTREFIAQHFLTVPDPGPEGEIHSHHFTVEARFAGPSLNEYGYLLDIDDVNVVLDDLEERYRDTLLNELPEFEGAIQASNGSLACSAIALKPPSTIRPRWSSPCASGRTSPPGRAIDDCSTNEPRCDSVSGVETIDRRSCDRAAGARSAAGSPSGRAADP